MLDPGAASFTVRPLIWISPANKSIDSPETKDLIRRGIHPDQLALEDYHFFKYSWSLELRRRDAIKAQKAHLENQRQQQEQEEVEDTGPHQPLRRVTQRLPQRNIFYIHSGYFVPKPTKHTQPFDVTCTLDYHAFLYDRFEYFPCKNSVCQLHMRCGMGEMPSPKNKAWRILN